MDVWRAWRDLKKSHKPLFYIESCLYVFKKGPHSAKVSTLIDGFGCHYGYHSTHHFVEA